MDVLKSAAYPFNTINRKVLLVENFGYRFHFNGMERNDEIKGFGNSYTTLFRIYDSRLGRWFSIDPETKLKLWESPYVSMGSTPIWHNDPLGNIDDAKVESLKAKNTKSSNNKSKSIQERTDINNGKKNIEVKKQGGEFTDVNQSIDIQKTGSNTSLDDLVGVPDLIDGVKIITTKSKGEYSDDNKTYTITTVTTIKEVKNIMAVDLPFAEPTITTRVITTTDTYKVVQSTSDNCGARYASPGFNLLTLESSQNRISPKYKDLATPAFKATINEVIEINRNAYGSEFKNYLIGNQYDKVSEIQKKLELKY